MPDPRLSRRFRILLHLLQRLEAPAGRPCQAPARSEAYERLWQDDWLGYETMLYESAATAVQDLERHLDRLEQGPPAGPPLKEPKAAPDQEQAARLLVLQRALREAFLQSEALALLPGRAKLKPPAAP